MKKKLTPENLHELSQLSPEELMELFPLASDDHDDEEKDPRQLPFGQTLKQFLDAFDAHENKIDNAAFAPVVTRESRSSTDNPLLKCIRYTDPKVEIQVYFCEKAGNPPLIIPCLIGAVTRQAETQLVERPNSLEKKKRASRSERKIYPSLAGASVELAAETPMSSEPSIRKFRVKIMLPENCSLVAAELHDPMTGWCSSGLATVSGKPKEVDARRVALLSCTEISEDEYELLTNEPDELLIRSHLVFRISKEA